MARVFAITVASPSLSLGEDRRGGVSFSVHNTGDQPRVGQAGIVALGEASAAWFRLGGEPTRDFLPDETHHFVVEVEVPSDAPAGEYRFRLDAYDEARPDEFWSEGPVVVLTVPQAPDGEPQRKIPIQWLKVILSAVLAAFVSGALSTLWLAVRARGSCEGSPSGIGEAIAAIFVCIFKLIFGLLFIYLALALVVAGILVFLLVEKRRIVHVALAVGISIPVAIPIGILLALLLQVGQ